MNSNRLYMNRKPAETVNRAFDFVGENWRLWSRVMAYFLLPFSVPLGATLASLFREGDTSISDMAIATSLVLFIGGCAVVTALEVLMVKWSEAHDGTLDGCTVSTLWRMMPKAVLKCLAVIVLGIPLMALTVVSIVIPVVGFASMFAVLPAFMVCPMWLLEPEQSLWEAVKRAFSLGFKRWGSLILLAVILGVVTMIINNAVTFPLGIFMALQSLLEVSDSDSVFWSLGIDIVSYVMSVAACFIIFVEIGLSTLAMTYHYGSVASQVEDIGLENDIENFANL